MIAKIISFPRYNHLETASLVSKMDIFLGMRLHSLILSFAYNVPFVSINYATKCHDFLNLIAEEDKEITFKDLTESRLINKLENIYKNRDSIKRMYQKKSNKYKQIVASNGLILRRIYEKAE